MNKIFKNGLIVFGVILLLLVIYFSGLLSIFNKYFSEAQNESCLINSDCVMKITSCGLCNCETPVNKNWELSCPFPSFGVVNCDECPPTEMFEIKCVDNQCKRFFKGELILE